METNLRHPRYPAWSGLTIADAAAGTTRRRLLLSDDLASLLPPSPLASVSLRWVEATPDKTALPGLEVTAGSQLLVIPEAHLTRERQHTLSQHPLVVWDAAADLPRLADATGQWPASNYCLTTMLRLLGNKAVPQGTDDHHIPDIRQAFEQRGLVPPYGWGNPTQRLAYLCDALLRELAAARLLATYVLERELLPVTRAMQRTGIGVDRARLKVVLAKYQSTTDEAANRLRREAGSPSLNPDDTSAVLAALCTLGLQIAGTDKQALCAANHPAVVALQDYRAAHGVHSAARAILDALDSGDRFHPRWDPIGTGTGRFACSDPAFQALPNNPDLRACIVSRPDHAFVRCDYSQADHRPLAFASQDAEMISIFAQDLDFHREAAARLLGKSAKEVSSAERSVSKAVVFGVVYGMSAETLAQAARLQYGLGWNAVEAQAWMDRFFAVFSGLRAWRERIRLEAVTATECRSLACGRRRLLPAGDEHLGYRFRCLLNMPAQGTVADAIKQAMVAIHAKLDGVGVIIANLHDELLLEVPQPRASEVARMVKAQMELALGAMLPGVAVKAKARVVANFAQ